MPPAATPLAVGGCLPGANQAPSGGPAQARADESAARDFAALLQMMLPTQPAALPQTAKRVDLGELVETTVAETGAAPDEKAVKAEGGIITEPTDGDLAHAHGVRTIPVPVETANTTRAGASSDAATGRAGELHTPPLLTRTPHGRALRPTEAAVERRRALAAAREAANAMMAGANGMMGPTNEMNAMRAATATTATGSVTSSTAMLDSDFSSRLERVISRMELAGHTVEVRETLRTPERQEALFAQGRTSTGPVVTWTLDSRHLDGRAADVMVDGKTSGKAYDLLHAIAAEEGLRTLGAKDPGHLELPRTTADARDGAAARRGASAFGGVGTDAMRATVVRPGGIAQVARIAQVADVAQPAQVASTAMPGLMTTAAPRAREAASDRAMTVAASRTRTGGLPAMRNVAANAAAELAVAAPADTATRMGPAATSQAKAERDFVNATVPTDDGSTAAHTATGTSNAAESMKQDASSQRGSEAERETVARAAERSRAVRRGETVGAAHEPMPRMAHESLRDLGGSAGTFGTRHSAAPITPAGSLAAERVAELLAARDARPAGTIGELRLAMDPVADGLSEVRLALQDGAIEATLRATDAGVARGLAAEVNTLTRSLERQGFDAARVTVQLEQAQQQRAAVLDTVNASEMTAGSRTLRGDSDAAREGRDDAHGSNNAHDTHDMHRDQQHSRQFGSRRHRTF